MKKKITIFLYISRFVFFYILALSPKKKFITEILLKPVKMHLYIHVRVRTMRTVKKRSFIHYTHVKTFDNEKNQ